VIEPQRFCKSCNYPLDGLAARSCPECGLAFDFDDPMSFNFGLPSPIKLYACRDGMEADLLRSLLIDRGIGARVLGEILGAALGELPPSTETLPAVWVNEAQSQQAMKVLHEFLGTRSEEGGDPWTCTNCGEDVEGQFAICWNCQTPRPDER
jgi:hypothetical protein